MSDDDKVDGVKECADDGKGGIDARWEWESVIAYTDAVMRQSL